MFLKLEGRPVVVVGGGTVAVGKVEGLLRAGAKVRLVAPELHLSLAQQVREGAIEWVARRFEPGDLAGAWLVVAATSAAGVNTAVFREAEARGILCNAVDDVENCHFYYGSVVRRGDL